MAEDDTQHQLELIKFKFTAVAERLENSENIDGIQAIKIIQSILKHSPDLDDQINLMKVTENILEKSYSIAELQHMFLSIKNEMKKRVHIQNFLYMYGDDYLTFNQNVMTATKLPGMKDSGVLIHKKGIFQIIPFELAFLKQFLLTKDQPITNVLLRPEIPVVYCYNHAIYSNALDISNVQAMPMFVRFLFYIINFQWSDALQVLNQEIMLNPQFEEEAFPFTIILGDMAKGIKRLTESRHKVHDTVFMNKQAYSCNRMEFVAELDPQTRYKVRKILDMISEITFYCKEVVTSFKNPYFRAVGYFMSMTDTNQQQSYQSICSQQEISEFLRFLIARRFMNPQNYDKFIQKVKDEVDNNFKLEHIIYLDHDESSFEKIKENLTYQFDQNVADFQKNSLVCLNILFKLFDIKEQKDIRKSRRREECMHYLVSTYKHYEKYLKSHRNRDIYKIYNQKFMNIPKTGIKVSKLTVRPQCIFMYEDSHASRTFVINMENLLRTSKIKEKDPSLRSSMFEAHCVICTQEIKSFDPLPFINDEIKGTQSISPYLKLSQKFDDGFVWCPRCLHGGHFRHMDKWFEETALCPYKSCKCKCKSQW